MKSSILLPAVFAALMAGMPLSGFSQQAQLPVDDSAPFVAEQPGYENFSLTSFLQETMPSVPSATSIINSCSSPCPNPYTAENISCSDGCCGSCKGCCRAYDVWGGAELLLWWAKGSNTPALVTTSPDVAAPGDAGQLGTAGVQVLAGNEFLGDEIQAGGRITFGLWLDPNHDVGAGMKFYALEGDDTSRTFGPSDGSGSPGNPILARPFFNALLGEEDALLIAFPGFATGSVNVNSGNSFTAAESYLRIMLERDRNHRVDLLAGYQFMRLDDRLSINSSSANIVGINFDMSDRFNTENEFHGGQLGLQGEMLRGRWSLNGFAKVSYGGMRQEVRIDGETIVTIPPGGPLPADPGSVFAQPTNIGTFSRTRGVFIPEFNINLAYFQTPNLSFSVGYDIIWLSSIVTSGDQIDRRVNFSQPIGPARPRFAFDDTSYYLQGLNLGMNWDF